MTIVMFNEIDSEHLKKVKEYMKTAGSPNIRVWHDESENIYWALEGSHRLVAAKELGITPVFEEIEYSDEIITLDLDGHDEEISVSEIVDRLLSWGNLSTATSRFIEF